MTIKCPKCDSSNITKRGKCLTKNNKQKQTYFCKNCNHRFQPKVIMPSWVKKAYKEYANKCMLLKDLSIKYSKSIPTINKYFDLLIDKKPENHQKNSTKTVISLVFDATFFKRYWKREICISNEQK